MHSCMMSRGSNCEMPRYDVAAWESALDLILGEVELPPVPRHRGPGPRQTFRMMDVLVERGSG